MYICRLQHGYLIYNYVDTTLEQHTTLRGFHDEVQNLLTRGWGCLSPMDNDSVRNGGMEGKREGGGRKRGRRGKEGKREGEREKERGREGEMHNGRERGREGEREGGKEGGRRESTSHIYLTTIPNLMTGSN